MKLNNLHHSLSDWDFFTPNYILSPDEFISPPTSLKETINAEVIALCRHPDTLNLPGGEIRTHFKRAHIAGLHNKLIFRSQAPLGSSNLTLCYYIELTWTQATLQQVTPGLVLQKGVWHFEVPDDEWYHIRAKFWTAVGGPYDGQLVVDLYIEQDAEWVSCDATVYDPDNLYPDTGIARCGLTIGRSSFTDNTEIAGP